MTTITESQVREILERFHELDKELPGFLRHATLSFAIQGASVQLFRPLCESWLKLKEENERLRKELGGSDGHK